MSYTRKKLNLAGVPQTRYFDILTCDDPLCGPHIIVLDPDNKPIVELVIKKSELPEILKCLSDCLYEKNMMGDE